MNRISKLSITIGLNNSLFTYIFYTSLHHYTYTIMIGEKDLEESFRSLYKSVSFFNRIGSMTSDSTL